jgi:hypothetical protein
VVDIWPIDITLFTTDITIICWFICRNAKCHPSIFANKQVKIATKDLCKKCSRFREMEMPIFLPDYGPNYSNTKDVIFDQGNVLIEKKQAKNSIETLKTVGEKRIKN